MVLLLFYYIFFFSEKSVTPQTDEVAMSPTSTDRATGNLLCKLRLIRYEQEQQKYAQHCIPIQSFDVCLM